MPNYNYPYIPNYSGIPTPTYPSTGTQPNQYGQYQQPYTTMPNYQYSNGYSNAVNNKNIIWVAGQAGAEAYQLEPGSRAVLLDSKDQIFYIKVVGMDGRPEPLMAFKYEPLNLNMQNESTQSAQQDMSNYVTKDDFNELKQMLEEVRSNKHNQQKGNRND